MNSNKTSEDLSVILVEKICAFSRRVLAVSLKPESASSLAQKSRHYLKKLLEQLYKEIVDEESLSKEEKREKLSNIIILLDVYF